MQDLKPLILIGEDLVTLIKTIILSTFLVSCSKEDVKSVDKHKKVAEILHEDKSIKPIINGVIFKNILISLNQTFDHIVCISPFSPEAVSHEERPFPIYVPDNSKSKISHRIFSKATYLNFVFVGNYHTADSKKWMNHYQMQSTSIGLKLKYFLINPLPGGKHIYTSKSLLQIDSFKELRSNDASPVKKFKLEKLLDKNVYHFEQNGVKISDAINSIDHCLAEGYKINNFALYINVNWMTNDDLVKAATLKKLYNFEMSLSKEL